MYLPENKNDFIRIAKALAVMDAILMRDWEYRYFSFNSKWADNEMMASMRNGQGDYWYALITANGIIEY